MIGQLISHYKILEKLGEGGMGVVYKAEDTKLKRTVALKFLPSHLSASDQDKARFIQEAQAASAINHPNICTIYSIDEHDRQLFIAMEFVDGQTLRQKNQTARFAQGVERGLEPATRDRTIMNPKSAIEIGIQIADGLAAAHEKGIVHRDIKPENIMIRKDGIAQIMDFGLAKLRGNVSRLTKEGSTVGTAGYMSPEQVQGQDADHRSDIFSFGVLLYELLTGQLPFKGVHETALAYEIVNMDAAPMSSIKPEIDPTLDAIVLDCLEKDPNERTQSMKQVSIDLKRFKRESSRTRVSRVTSAMRISPGPKVDNTASRVVTTRERLIWITLVAVLLVIVVGVIVVRWQERTLQPMTIRFTIQPPEKTTINQLALSPDGNFIAFTATGQGKTLLWLHALNAVAPHPLNSTEDATFPFWSPDGRAIGFFASGKLKKIDLAGGAPMTICDAPNGRGGTWNKDGEILFAPSTNGILYRVSAGGGVPKAVSSLDTARHEYEHVWPFFLSDGKKFLYAGRTVRDDELTIFLSSLDSKENKPILKSFAHAVYSPPSHVVFLRERSLMAQEIDVNAGSLVGDPSPIAENVGRVPILALGAFTVSSNGVLVTGGGRSVNRQFAWFDRSGRQLGVVGPPGNYFDIFLSPDGRRAATQRVDLQTGNSDIWILDIERGSISRFTFGPTVEDDPVWSPDGSRLLFSSTRDGAPNIYQKISGGTGSEEALFKSNFTKYPCDWSRDGRFILFEQLDPKTKADLWVLPASVDRQPFPFVNSEFDESRGQFSPDGKWIAYSSNETGKFEVYVQSFTTSGAKWQVSTNGGSQPRWRKDGTELFYIAPDRKLMAVEIKSGTQFDYGIAKPLFETHVDNYDVPNRYVVAEHGQRFLINVPVEEASANPVTVVVNWTAELKKK